MPFFVLLLLLLLQSELLCVTSVRSILAPLMAIFSIQYIDH